MVVTIAPYPDWRAARRAASAPGRGPSRRPVRPRRAARANANASLRHPARPAALPRWRQGTTVAALRLLVIRARHSSSFPRPTHRHSRAEPAPSEGGGGNRFTTTAPVIQKWNREASHWIPACAGMSAPVRASYQRGANPRRGKPQAL